MRSDFRFTISYSRVSKLEAEKKAEAEAKAKADEAAKSLLSLLDARGIAMDAEAREKITNSGKTADLETWLVRAAAAKPANDVFVEQRLAGFAAGRLSLSKSPSAPNLGTFTPI